ncbi:hypothetical protein RSAG8_04006, partial [Rhizoctonia solani AG-8 WAC10335]
MSVCALSLEVWFVPSRIPIILYITYKRFLVCREVEPRFSSSINRVFPQLALRIWNVLKPRSL